MSADVTADVASADAIRRRSISDGGTERGAQKWLLWRYLAPFARQFQPKRFTLNGNVKLTTFFDWVRCCAVDADLRDCDDEEWANLVFSSAVIKAARVARGQSNASPMAHFLHVLELGTKFDLVEGARRNLDDLKTFVLYELGVDLHAVGLQLEELVEVDLVDEPAPRPAPPAPEPKPIIRAAAPAKPAPPAELAPQGDSERKRRAALTAIYMNLEASERAALDHEAEQRARAELGSAASQMRLGLLKVEWRWQLLVELYPEHAARASA